MDGAEKGLIELGGCCVFGDDPRMLCKACGEAFDRPATAAHSRRRYTARP